MTRTTMSHADVDQALIYAWVLLHQAEERARDEELRDESPSLWSIATWSLQHAAQALQIVVPDLIDDLVLSAAPRVDLDCLSLARAAQDQLQSIPFDMEPQGLSYALVRVTDALREVEGRHRQ